MIAKAAATTVVASRQECLFWYSLQAYKVDWDSTCSLTADKPHHLLLPPGTDLSGVLQSNVWCVLSLIRLFGAYKNSCINALSLLCDWTGIRGKIEADARLVLLTRSS